MYTPLMSPFAPGTDKSILPPRPLLHPTSRASLWLPWRSRSASWRRPRRRRPCAPSQAKAPRGVFVGAEGLSSKATRQDLNLEPRAGGSLKTVIGTCRLESL